MGILKGQQELIPMTCAILKNSDRDAFFSQIRRNRAGSPAALAQWLGVPVSLIEDWISGRVHIPYHTLQNIAYQFSVEMPPVAELRRESLPAAQLPTAKPPEPPAQPRIVRSEHPRRERKPRRSPAQKRPKTTPPDQTLAGRSAPRSTVSPRWPKPSERLAYWAGMFYAAARTELNSLSFSAARRIGQNFAGVWAKKTQELFGVTCRLTTLDNGKTQIAECEIPELTRHLSRYCPSGERAAVPRWVWSTESWKSAFARGFADASGHLHGRSSLVLEAPARILQSVQKLLHSLGFKPQTGDAGILAIGREELERYFNSVGTENMKLRDQLQSFSRPKTVYRGKPSRQIPSDLVK